MLVIDIRGLWPASSGQGLQLTLVCRRAVSATFEVITQRGSCDVRKPRGLNGRLGTRSACEIAALSVTEKAPEQSGQPMSLVLRESGA